MIIAAMLVAALAQSGVLLEMALPPMRLGLERDRGILVTRTGDRISATSA